MSNPFQLQPVTHDMPARNAAAVTTHNSNDLPVVTRGIMIGDGSTMSVIFAEDTNAVQLTALIPGVVYPFAVRRVRTTGTDATGIVAFW